MAQSANVIDLKAKLSDPIRRVRQSRIKAINAAELAAERAVASYIREFVASRKAMANLQLNAIGHLYVVKSQLADDAALRSLMRRHDVRIHGNLKNRDLLVVLCFIKNRDRDLASQRSIWAALLSYAAEKKIKADLDAFKSFILAQGGLHAAYARWCALKLQSAMPKKLAAAKTSAQRVAAIRETLPDLWNTSCSTTREAVRTHRAGWNLAVIDLRPDGSYRLVRILPRAHEQVAAALGAANV